MGGAGEVIRSAGSTDWLEWGVASAPMGEEPLGDGHVVAVNAQGALLAVIDGLGHGKDAAIATAAAVAVLEKGAGEPVEALIQDCHRALAKTRGAVISAAWVEAGSTAMRWVGVGNVEAVIRRGGPAGGREHMMLRGGVVGYQLPPLRPSTLQLGADDALILHTDGVRSGESDRYDPIQTPEANAARLLELGSKGSDDALVLVVRRRAPASR